MISEWTSKNSYRSFVIVAVFDCICFFFSRSAPVIYRRRLRLCIVKLHTCVICKIVTFINGSFISLSRGCWFFFLFPTIARSWLLCTFLIVTFWHINFACVCVVFFTLASAISIVVYVFIMCFNSIIIINVFDNKKEKITAVFFFW